MVRHDGNRALYCGDYSGFVQLEVTLGVSKTLPYHVLRHGNAEHHPSARETRLLTG